MPGINQLPEGAEGAAAFVLIYSSISWICSWLMAWLTWVHRERLSYVAIIAYWTILSTAASIIQQIHDITFWRDVMKEQFARKSRIFDNPELAVANGSYGMDLVLYYIQYYTYNVEAMCVMFWALELAQSVYGWDAKVTWKRNLRIVNKSGPFISMLLPLTTILLLQAPPVRKDFVLFIVLADFPLLLNLTTGSITMVAILARYLRTKKKFSQWTPPNGNSNTSGTIASSSVSTRISSNLGSERGSMKQRGIYDRWLMVRFTCAFILLATFDVTNTLFQITAAGNNLKDSDRAEPDLSLQRAYSTIFLFLPGVTPGIFLFIIFGTTTGHRKKLSEILVPKRWKKSKSTQLPNRQQNNWERDSRRLSQPPHFRLSRQNIQVENSYVTKPLPLRPASNLRSIFSPEHRATTQRGWDEDAILNARSSVQMHDLNDPRESCDQYYGHNPEYSDDSGPILPIMETGNRHSIG